MPALCIFSSCNNRSVFRSFSLLFEAGVSVDVRYTHHPAAAAETADAGTSCLQHCDFQSRLSQTCCEGSASFSDYKPSFQPYRNSSKEGLEGRSCCKNMSMQHYTYLHACGSYNWRHYIYGLLTSLFLWRQYLREEISFCLAQKLDS